MGHIYDTITIGGPLLICGASFEDVIEQSKKEDTIMQKHSVGTYCEIILHQKKTIEPVIKLWTS